MIPPTLDDAFVRALVEAGPDALVVCDGEGRIVMMNGQAERLYGYAAAELVGQGIEVLVPEHKREAHVGERTRFTENPHPRPMASGLRLSGRRRDGTHFPAEVSLSPVHTPSGLYIAAAVRDVTERRKMEQALAAAEARLREVVEQAPDGIVVTDLARRFTEVNAAACRMLGYTREELLGKTILDLIPAEHEPRIQEQRKQLEQPGAILRTEWTLRRKDGSHLPVEISATTLADGRRQAIFRDIGGRVRLEREHARALERLRLVLAQCPVGIVLMNRQGDDVRLELNDRARELMGREETPRVGEYVPYMQHLDGSPLRAEDAATLRVLRGEQVSPTDLVLNRPDGTSIPIQVRGAPLHGPDGEVEGAIVAFEDITAEKDLERLRTEWNAIVAHDLRNPLNVITLHARLLARLAKGNQVLADSVDEIQGAATRMNRMIHDLLDISRLEAKKLSLNLGKLRLGVAVQAAVDRAALTAPGRPFEIRVADAVPEVLADPDRVAQILDNLLSNAVKYGADGTPIAVSIEVTEGAAAVAVTNEGAGLTPEMRTRLFQRFHRSAEGALAGVKGIGLGLYIARELVEAHGGRMGVESDPGGKTTFRFTLPVA
jgi:PAS domain S-box-containing protein